MEIKLNSERHKLAEGRNTGIGFAFAKIENNILKGVDAISACKDYLNDFVWSEKYKCNSKPIYGYSHKYCGFFENRKKHTLLLVSSLNTLSETWPDYTQDCEKLNDNYKNIELLINDFELLVNSKYRTKIKKVSNNLYLLKLSKYWVQETALISFVTLIARIAYSNNVTTVEQLKTFKETNIVNHYQKNNFLNCINKIPLITNFNYTNENTHIMRVHSSGCLSDSFKNFLDNL